MTFITPLNLTIMTKASFIFLFAIVLFSCSKKDDNNCATDVAHISGSYKITKVTYKPDAASPESDYFNTLFTDACERDNLYTFKSDGTYLLADVGIACDPIDSDDGTWSISGNTMQIDGEPIVVEKFDCKILVLKNSGIDVDGDELRLTLTRE